MYEHYPRPGWVDAAVYTSYATVDDAYKEVDSFGLAVNGATYQHSRISYIGPLRLLGSYLGEIEGRLIFNLALFLIYCIASIKICDLILEQRRYRSLLMIFFTCNPLVVISIVSGGADGPAAIYSLVSLAFLAYALKRHHWAYFFQSGTWLALSLSAHIFSAIPYLLALIPLLFLISPSKAPSAGLLKISLPNLLSRNLAKYLLHYSLGFISVIYIINIAAKHLGIEKFFLSYSFGRAQNSLQGSGQKFNQPIEFAIQNSAPWIGALLFLSVAFIFWFDRSHHAKNARYKLRLRGSLLGFSFPLFFVLIFDLFIGGSLIISPHYFSLFFPAFAIALAVLFSALDSVIFSKAKFFIVQAAVLLSFASSAFPHNNSASFSFSGIDSKSLYASQIDFKDSALRLAEGAVFNIVYSKTNLSSRGDYIDYFEGKKRSFDYIDTLAYTFPWSGDKMHLVSLREDKRFSFELKKGMSTLIFSNTSNELNKLLGAIHESFGVFSLKSRECGDRTAYNWCLAVIEYGH
ncbi:hypothetical protein LJR039_000284 [Pseudorhodoferax sp. LjRoot39]|uniref:hypothetical protein n=1 Tax=Pseudorhodoferax sp. LjRoot39 TaxID=3342328 RepID=UPI003ECCB44D